jgi:RNA polymerase sigma-70 factor, ECF subfamily
MVDNHRAIPETMLIERLQSHSQEAFSALYDNYAPSLLGVIFNIVKDRDEAEDLLQDSFIKIWRSIRQYESGKGRLFTWLLTICRNTALDYLRKRGKLPAAEIQNAETNVYTNSTGENIRDTGLQNEVEKLDTVYRQVINLIYFFGYTQQEVSAILKLPLGTVKTRTRTALQLLRKQCNHN